MLAAFVAGLVLSAVSPAPLVLFGGNAAWACGAKVEIQFFESDGDIFAIRNKSEAPFALVSLVIRLTGSRGRLFFDTADGGPGESMPEAFAPVDNNVGFLGATAVNDGDEQVALRFSDFQPGRGFMFVVDVDDRLDNSDFGQAVISGDEIEGAGAEAFLSMKGGRASKVKGVFGPDGRALLKGGVCA